MNVCRICGNQRENATYVAREMQLGMGDEFEYFQCSRCECLQIKEIPQDLSKYYPDHYYSYQPALATVDFSHKAWSGYKQRFIVSQLTKHYFGNKNALGRLLAKRSELARDYPLWVRQQKLDLQLKPDSSILDVGCGKGRLLLDLFAYGFTNLTGIDPFLETDVFYDNGVKVYRKSLDELDQKFDLIMLNHSFEHIPNQLATLEKLRELLRPNRHLLLRIPVTNSYGWRKYGTHWHGLDPPRHLYLHTRASIELLANQAGFKVAEVVFDALGFTHWASEQYLAGISLMDPRSYAVDRSASIFSEKDIEKFVNLDAELNAKGDADCAGFYLRID